jgi:hypothetical protein
MPDGVAGSGLSRTEAESNDSSQLLLRYRDEVEEFDGQRMMGANG